MTQKLVKIVGSYSIDGVVVLKSGTNDNISSWTCLNFDNFVWMVLLLPWNCPETHPLIYEVLGYVTHHFVEIPQANHEWSRY